MKNITVLFLTLIVSAIFLGGCNNKPDNVNVRIITTTDIHANIFEYDFIRDTITRGGLSRVMTFVEAQRAGGDTNIVLLDNADLLQGQPSGYYFNHVSSRDENLFASVLNYMRFDAASVGNHDIEMGPGVYNKLKEEFNFPWLAANILDKETGEPYFKPYTIINKQGVKLAILGLITPSVPNWLPAHLWEGLEFADMLETAAYWVPVILEKEKPDALIGLFHSGSGDESGLPVAFAENASVMVARNVPGFDVIFTGHDHRLTNLQVPGAGGKDVLILAGLPFGRSVAVADFSFKRKPEGGYAIKSVSGDIIEMKDYEPFPEFLMKFENELKQAKDYTSQKIGKLSSTLSTRDAYIGNSAFVDFIHKIQLQLTGAQISFAAPLSFNASLAEGDLTMRDMFRLYPFENYLYVMELTGREIRNALEFSYGMWFSTMKKPGDNALLFRKTADGTLETTSDGRPRFVNPFFNFDSAAGMDYTVDISKLPGDRIRITKTSDGLPFSDEKIYKVAINSYRGSGGGNHLTTGAGIGKDDLAARIVWISDKDMRSLMADWIKQQDELLNPEAGNNWKVIPENLATEALKNDLRLLFP